MASTTTRRRATTRPPRSSPGRARSPGSSNTSPEPRIRDATDADFADIRESYGHHVMHGLASFEESAPGEAELRNRRQAVLALGLPYLVAERAGCIVGYAYATQYRARSAYRHSLENSVYVRDGHGG